MKKNTVLISAAAAVLLTACGTGSSEAEMQYIKTSVLYDTLSDMYQNPDAYLGKQFHIVGTLYPSTDHDGETFYSVYAEETRGGHGIGLELDWNDFSGFTDYETVTVEGTLDKEKGNHDGEEIQYLILRVSKLEKRDS
ncbi:MAG: hypothetical protein IKQ91_03780 [Oscillospiraceae bacterium]|nr:hypothetical protein [Oscillospiraceae bacterium]